MRRTDDVLISVADAATLLGVSRATVWRYIKQEHDPLPADQIGHGFTLWKSDVEAYRPKAKRSPGPKRGSKRRRVVEYRQARPRVLHCAAEASADYRPAQAAPDDAGA